MTEQIIVFKHFYQENPSLEIFARKFLFFFSFSPIIHHKVKYLLTKLAVMVKHVKEKPSKLHVEKLGITGKSISELLNKRPSQ
jgi:hypothetical protein